MARIGIFHDAWGVVGGGPRYIGVLADVLSQSHAVEIIHTLPIANSPGYLESLGVFAPKVSFRQVNPITRTNRQSWIPWQRFQSERECGREISAPYDVFIYSSDLVPFFCHARVGVLWIHFPWQTFEEMHCVTTAADSALRAPLLIAKSFYATLEWRLRFKSYRFSVANSYFTKEWVKRRWGVDSAVVFPPMRDELRSQDKARRILVVSRFESSGVKNQGALLDVFRKMCIEGNRGWNLTFVGGLRDRDADRKYLAELQDQAAGLSIDFRPNASNAELRELLETSSILWHAKGYGYDQEKQPGMMEHFGMVTVEAMSAGCVPVTFCGGGQPEIVEHGRTGYLWKSLSELESYTLKLFDDSLLRCEIAERAIGACHRFSEREFRSRVEGVMRDVERYL